MALVIYIDVLLVVNLYINYFLVRGTSLMLRRKVSPRRVILASAVGAVGSLLDSCSGFEPDSMRADQNSAWDRHNFRRLWQAEQNRLSYQLAVIPGRELHFWRSNDCSVEHCRRAGIFVRNGTAYFDIPIIAAVTVYSRSVWRIPRIQNDNRQKKTAEPCGRQNPKRRRRSYAGRALRTLEIHSGTASPENLF